MAVVSMKQLLEAGVHFGHQTRRWNPKMAPYIYTERNGIYIIDLQKTVKKLEEAYNFVRETSANGGNILFVGTKKQAQDAILAEEAAASTENESNVPQQEPVAPANEASQYLGTMLGHNPMTGLSREDDDADKKLAERKGLSKIGDEISHKAEIRDGWIDIDKSLLGERALFYPEDWQFRVRPATVEAIRNWSMIDDENPLSVDDVFNEVLKSCIAIVTPEGPKPWGNICSWDRFFFLLLIREYTFKQGESEVAYEEDCPECDNPVKFTLTSQSLSYELPDPEVMPMYDRETRTWNIDPTEYDVDADVTTFYVPTLEKDANIKAWLIARYNDYGEHET